MIARHETNIDKTDIWAQLSAPLPTGVISWRQDGRPVARDGKYVARFGASVDANTGRARLDGVVPGEWDLTLELLPVLSGDDSDDARCSFKARLQILGVIREDVGTGRDYKQAATDAFKRAAVRFGIAHELYAYEQNWVQVDGDGKFAKPLEDPARAYARRLARAASKSDAAIAENVPADDESAATHAHVASMTAADLGPLASDEPSCPKCGGRMWDNRLSKRNPKAPDYKCRSRSCDGVIWPLRNGTAPAPRTDSPEPVVAELDAATGEIPF